MKKTLSVVKKSSNKPSFYIVISKKVFPLANKRNLIKRRLRSAFREVLGKKKMNFTIVSYPKKEVLNKNYKELVLELQRAISKL